MESKQELFKNEELIEKIADAIINKIPVMKECPYGTLEEIIEDAIKDFEYNINPKNKMQDNKIAEHILSVFDYTKEELEVTTAQEAIKVIFNQECKKDPV